MSKLSQSSEIYGTNKLLEIFTPTFPGVRVLQNIILPLGEGYGPCPTAEFDVVVVCSAGVMIFEIKGHDEGRVSITKGENGIRHWKIHKPQGVLDIPDPVAQGGRKIRFLRDSIPDTTIRGYVYFTSPKIVLPPTAPSDVLTTSDLGYLPRSLRTESRRKKKEIDQEKINNIADAMLALSQGLTLEKHIQNCKKTYNPKKKPLLLN